jgi:hypothetical protein
MLPRFLYIFLDEAGDLGCRPNSSPYFILGSLTVERPFGVYNAFTDLKYDLLEGGVALEYFHASEDSQAIRDKVFQIIQANLANCRIDSLIVEKRKTVSELQSEEKFYPKMLGYLLKYVLNRFTLSDYSNIIIMTDTIPIKRKRKAVEKAIKLTLASMLPPGTAHTIVHHASKSNFNLQVIDYCSWAIYRKWHSEGSDTRSYDLVKKAIKSEFNIFRTGKFYYY